MKDNKKHFIAKSLNNIEDKYIEEAINFKKNKFNSYRQIIGFVAGAIIVFGGMSINNKMKEQSPMDMESAEMEENQMLDNKETADVDFEIKVTYSKGINIEEIKEVKITANMESNVAEDMDLGRLDPYYFRSKNIVRGTISDIKYYKISSETETYISVVTIKTNKVYNGSMEENMEYRIYVPEILNELEIDREAIFIVDKSTEETGVHEENSYFSYIDLSDYHMESVYNGIFIEEKSSDTNKKRYLKDLDYIEENILSILE